MKAQYILFAGLAARAAAQCYYDPCMVGVAAHPKSASSYCSSYATATPAASPRYPAFVSGCGSNAQAVSSACACFLSPGSATVSKPTITSTVTSTSTVTKPGPTKTVKVTSTAVSTTANTITTTETDTVTATTTEFDTSTITTTETDTLTATSAELDTSTITVIETDTTTVTELDTATATITSFVPTSPVPSDCGGFITTTSSTTTTTSSPVPLPTPSQAVVNGGFEDTPVVPDAIGAYDPWSIDSTDGIMLLGSCNPTITNYGYNDGPGPYITNYCAIDGNFSMLYLFSPQASQMTMSQQLTNLYPGATYTFSILYKLIEISVDTPGCTAIYSLDSTVIATSSLMPGQGPDGPYNVTAPSANPLLTVTMACPIPSNENSFIGGVWDDVSLVGPY